MKIVIDISENDYKIIKASVNKTSSDYRILEGTILSEALEERPTGEWEKAINLCTDKVVFRCSACGRLVENCSRANLAEFYPYCNCGADMRGGAEK